MPAGAFARQTRQQQGVYWSEKDTGQATIAHSGDDEEALKSQEDAGLFLLVDIVGAEPGYGYCHESGICGQGPCGPLDLCQGCQRKCTRRRARCSGQRRQHAQGDCCSCTG